MGKEGDRTAMNPLIDVRAVTKSYSNTRAVKGVSFTIRSGETIGLVGESGSGKTTLARLILGLERPDQGEILVTNRNPFQMKPKDRRQMRKQIQAVFQDPSASLNPRLSIFSSVMEPLDNFPEIIPPFLTDVRHSRAECATRLLHMVGLTPDILDRYPHQLSGGQKQRVAIARGISIGPPLLVCDEPTASLDASVGAQILNLLKSLQENLKLSYLFISHDMRAVRFISHRILVMKQGQILDRFHADQMMEEARHPYTRQLIQFS